MNVLISKLLEYLGNDIVETVKIYGEEKRRKKENRKNVIKEYYRQLAELIIACEKKEDCSEIQETIILEKMNDVLLYYQCHPTELDKKKLRKFNAEIQYRIEHYTEGSLHRQEEFIGVVRQAKVFVGKLLN